MIRVVPFIITLSGAIVDDSQIATDEEIDTLLDSIFDNTSGSTINDSQVASYEKIIIMFDDIFG